MKSQRSKIGIALTACALAGLVAVSLALGAKNTTSAAPVGSGTASATKSVCGMGTGKKATGTPVKIGSINMEIPGVDFTTMAKVVAGYFACVNDNGGINGHPVKYTWYSEQLNPAQQAALARKIVESDKVVGLVGNTSFTECGNNWKYFKSKGFVVIGAGVQAECFGVPNIVESNMGPRYSNIGAAQALIRAGVKSIAIASPDTISAYADGGVVELGKKSGVAVKVFPTALPIADASSTILKLVQAAGTNGGVILDFTPGSAPPLLKAAIAQGLVDKVKWGSSTPIADTFMAESFPEFDGKMYINSEFSLLDPSVGPDTRLMLQILKKYVPSIGPQAFAQMGFMDGKFATVALLRVKGPITIKSYNAQVRGLKNIKTDMLCKPWYVGNALPYHIPNNTDITVDYKDGKVVLKEKCFNIAAVDPELAQTRAWEKKFNLNTGK
jgi:branched-chain amino acid transport system substrate-binding protein